MLSENDLQQAFDDATPVLWKGESVIVASFEVDQIVDGDQKHSEVVSVTVLLNGKEHKVSPSDLSFAN
jgi:hypothetical protein